jgi:HSP20 family protein
MALFSPFYPWVNNRSLLDDIDDFPFLNMNSSFFRDNNIGRSNRANVSEVEGGYKVEVEVPGYQKPEISIEFGHDEKSITISGRTQKVYEEAPTEETNGAKNVTVEDEPDEAAKDNNEAKKPSTEVATTNQEKAVGAPAAPKYWISERTTGSFSRSFTFPTRVDTEKSTASLEHGVLTVMVPKATKGTVKRISIA